MTDENNKLLEKILVLENKLKTLNIVPPMESEQTNELCGALAKAQGEMEFAKEESNNPFFKSKYADLQSIVKSTRPYLAKNGLCIMHRIMSNGNGREYLHARLAHTSGQWVESKMELKPTKADMQGVGSAITYAKRYTYAALVGAVAGEDDDDGNAACANTKKETPKQMRLTATQVQELLKEINSKGDPSMLKMILKHYDISKLPDLPVEKFEPLLKHLKEEWKNESNN